MFVPLLIFASVGCMGLFAALRPEEYTRYFLGESQRKALSGNFKAVSSTGWVIFCGCITVVIAIPFHSKWNLLAPVLGPLLFLVCAGAYAWWGTGLLRNPESFLNRASGPWSRFPVWVVRGFGSLLLFGAAAFLYGFPSRVRVLLR
jgi:hypothetical protein